MISDIWIIVIGLLIVIAPIVYLVISTPYWFVKMDFDGNIVTTKRGHKVSRKNFMNVHLNVNKKYITVAMVGTKVEVINKAREILEIYGNKSRPTNP